VLERVVVVEPALLRVKRRVEVGEPDLAEILLGKLWELGQARQRVECVAADEQVIAGAFRS
jgi:hypothetical protein